jgi:hypothetical protein
VPTAGWKPITDAASKKCFMYRFPSEPGLTRQRLAVVADP